MILNRFLPASHLALCSTKLSDVIRYGSETYTYKINWQSELLQKRKGLKMQTYCKFEGRCDCYRIAPAIKMMKLNNRAMKKAFLSYIHYETNASIELPLLSEHLCLVDRRQRWELPVQSVGLVVGTARGVPGGPFSTRRHRLCRSAGRRGNLASTGGGTFWLSFEFVKYLFEIAHRRTGSTPPLSHPPCRNNHWKCNFPVTPDYVRL